MKRFTFALAGSSDCAPHSAAVDLDDAPEGGVGAFGGVDETMEHFSGVPRAPSQSFVGRDQALSELNAAIVQSLQGRGSLVLISGEPGIGKTRLMAEFGALAQRAGVKSLWGNCWEGGEAPVFWPWIQILRAYRRGRDAEELQRELGSAARELQAILPELADCTVDKPSAGGPGAVVAQEARFRLFDAVARLVRRAARVRPLLINIDNLHAADEASLQLLRFVASDLHDARVLMLASYRESDAGSETPLWRLLGELGTGAQRIQLTGLAPDDIAQLIREFGVGVPPELARALHARTQGNPFFVREVLRLHGAGQNAFASVPDSVAQVIERRLSRIGASPLALLRSAAVLGSEFTADLLSAASGQTIEDVQALLPGLVSSRLLALDRSVDSYRFAHALVREVCYAQLADAQRRELHRNVAKAIEQPERGDARPAEVAFHYQRAGTLEDLRCALTSSVLAADAARRVGALEDAINHLERALELTARVDSADERRRCELLLELGSAQMARGLVVAAQKTHARAAQLAQARGDTALLARAALGFGVEFGAGGSNEQEVELLEAALAVLPEADSALRARVMSRLSRALLFGVRHAERIALAEAALAMARRLDDRATLASVLYARHQSLWTGAPAEVRCAIADEIVQLAEENGDRELAMQARALRLGDLLELAALDRYRAECASYARLVHDENLVTSGWHVPMQQATLAMLGGQFVEAERLGAEGLSLGKRLSHQGIEVFHHSVLMTIRYLQGRHAELLPVLRHGAEAYPTLPVFRAGLALAHAERGERLEASLVFERLADQDFGDVPRDILWVFNLALLSITAHFLGDVARAKLLYEWLEPYANYNVRVTRIGISSIGSTQHYLGLLAITFADTSSAVAHFERAVVSHQRQGALPMLANSQLQLARALQRRGAASDDKQASEARARATELAQSLCIRLVLAELDATSPPPSAADAQAPQRTVRLKREGPDWLVEQSGRTLRWRNAVGMEMLARLLREPGREFAALELRGSEAVAGLSNSDAGELLDDQATQSYRDRATELRDQIAEAGEMNDVGRAASAREELEQLEQELRRAIGLGGRARRAGATYERARISVTKAIRTALKKIAEQDAALGAHLERSVKTGQVCAYSPDPTADVRWEVEG
jgi:tetratricopeptide (TPR) repeat protein